MARTIQSPGVEVRELDFSLYTETRVGTNVAVYGFAHQGPVDEPITISTVSQFEEVFGQPRNAAERYMYHTSRQILSSPANLTVTRLPYGSGDGAGYGNTYGALAYPMLPYAPDTDPTDGWKFASKMAIAPEDLKAKLCSTPCLSALYNSDKPYVRYLTDLPELADGLNCGDCLSDDVYQSIVCAAVAGDLNKNTIEFAYQDFTIDTEFAIIVNGETVINVYAAAGVNVPGAYYMNSGANFGLVSEKQLRRFLERVFPSATIVVEFEGRDATIRICGLPDQLSVSTDIDFINPSSANRCVSGGNIEITNPQYTFPINQIGDPCIVCEHLIETDYEQSPATFTVMFTNEYAQAPSVISAAYVGGSGSPTVVYSNITTTSMDVEVTGDGSPIDFRVCETLANPVEAGSSIDVTPTVAPGTLTIDDTTQIIVAETPENWANHTFYNNATITGWRSCSTELIPSSAFSVPLMGTPFLEELYKPGGPNNLKDIYPFTNDIAECDIIPRGTWDKIQCAIINGCLPTVSSLTFEFPDLCSDCESTAFTLYQCPSGDDPEYQIVTIRPDEGDDRDRTIFLNGPCSTFCYASAKDYVDAFTKIFPNADDIITDFNPDVEGSFTVTVIGTDLTFWDSNEILGNPDLDGGYAGTDASEIFMKGEAACCEGADKFISVELDQYQFTLPLELTDGETFKPIVETEPSGFYIGPPAHLELNEVQYEQVKCGGFNWADIGSLISDSQGVCGFDAETLGGFGMIILNETRTVVEDDFAGYYVTVTDNKNARPTTSFDDITGVKASKGNECNGWSDVPQHMLAFDTDESFDGIPGSTSEIIENIPLFNFDDTQYDDSVIVSLWKLRPSAMGGSRGKNVKSCETGCKPDWVYNPLDDILVESFVGSFDSFRKETNPFNTVLSTFFIENLINNNSRHLSCYVNPYISELGGWTNDLNQTDRAIRIYRNLTKTNAPAGAIANWEFADNMYSIGAYLPHEEYKGCSKDVGNVPAKLDRALKNMTNPDLYDLDITVDGGLSTIWATVKDNRNSWCTGDSREPSYTFDDTVWVDVDSSLAYNPQFADETNYDPAGSIANNFATIYNLFNTYAERGMKRAGGVGHLHIQDSLRQVFVNGRDCKVLTNVQTKAGKTFSRNVYWPLRNLFDIANSSYSVTYGNWSKVYDFKTDKFTWAPFSGFAAAAMAVNDSLFTPWSPAAGLSRGVVSGVSDIAINPNQHERDMLYKIGINPVVLFPQDGLVIWGQKTLLKRPSAFDRINVRRLFLSLEKVTLRTMRQFVFEPNTAATRTRAINAVEPAFRFAQSTDGVYDYLIVSDERNNTPTDIDNNELCMDIYLKPVKTAEFICVNFIATRTGQDFSELTT